MLASYVRERNNVTVLMLNRFRFYCARICGVKVDSGRWTSVSEKTNARDTHIMTAVAMYTNDGHML